VTITTCEFFRLIGAESHEQNFRSSNPWIVAALLVDRLRFTLDLAPTYRTRIRSVSTLAEAWQRDSTNSPRIRCTRKSRVFAIRFDYTAARRHAEQALGLFPHTLAIQREGSRAAIHLVRAAPDCPAVRPGPFLGGSGCRVREGCPLPGSTCRETFARFAWLPGHSPDECEIATLAQEWLSELPVHVTSIKSSLSTLKFVPRAQFGDRSNDEDENDWRW
jgi:hypothetical protein